MKTKVKILFLGFFFLAFTILSFTGQIPNLMDTTEKNPMIQQIVGIIATLGTFLYLVEFTYGKIHGLIKKSEKKEDALFLLKNTTNI